MEKQKALQKERLIRLFKKALPFLGVGFAYYLFVRLSGHGIPCIIKAITGAYCPGCGISRMFLALIGGDIQSAAGYNLLALLLLPFGAFWAGFKAHQYIKTGRTETKKWENIFFLVIFILAIAFWIMRNLPQFAFLAPAPYGI